MATHVIWDLTPWVKLNSHEGPTAYLRLILNLNKEEMKRLSSWKVLFTYIVIKNYSSIKPDSHLWDKHKHSKHFMVKLTLCTSLIQMADPTMKCLLRLRMSLYFTLVT